MSTEKTDVDIKLKSPLCTYGRDEDYIKNKFWLAGISTVILYGVGDGMIAWVCLQLRIPIMCVYDRQLHQKTIEDFLLNKVIEKMEEATPEDTRWYRSNAMLGCREDADSKAAVVKPSVGKPKIAVAKKKCETMAAAKKKALGKKASGDEGASAGSGSSSSSSSSKKNAKKQKTEEAKTNDE